MVNMHTRTTGFRAACLSAILVLWLIGVPAAASAQASGPTPQDCFSERYHAASDCDRLAFSAAIPQTGAGVYSPTGQECYSSRFHAASDCDRIAYRLAFP